MFTLVCENDGCPHLFCKKSKCFLTVFLPNVLCVHSGKPRKNKVKTDMRHLALKGVISCCYHSKQKNKNTFT